MTPKPFQPGDKIFRINGRRIKSEVSEVPVTFVRYLNRGADLTVKEFPGVRFKAANFVRWVEVKPLELKTKTKLERAKSHVITDGGRNTPTFDNQNKQTMKTGHIKLVQNKDRKFGSAESYNCIYVHFPGTLKPRPIMLTDSELRISMHRSDNNEEDLPKCEPEPTISQRKDRSDILTFIIGVGSFLLGLIYGLFA